MTLKRSLAMCCGGVVVVTSAVLAAPVQASEYRYWTYWTSTTQDWAFSSLGPAFRPADESIIEGWRLAVTGVDATKPPRVEVADVYVRACGDVTPKAGILRIAVVLDYGTSADAPVDESPPGLVIACAAVPEGSTGFDALKSITDIRSERGFVCGLSGYPATGCGRETVEPSSEPHIEPASEPSAEPTPSPRESFSSTPTTESPHAQPLQTSSSPSTASWSAIAVPTNTSASTVAPETVSSAKTATPTSSGTGPLLAIVVLAGIVSLGVLAWTRSRGRQ
ncbi:unannotated protein [freshwater metagenome]|uniref:Unannotated protein n=1 Tax=freshwater metagenome TaxID=449393 RepID=A0A6J7GGL0_9ZZZZ|nr:hypothetical protein [Actinomycetota bacterium]